MNVSNELKKFQLSSKITKIAEVDNRYMELTMIVSDTSVNLNGVSIPKDVLLESADSLVNPSMPLVVDKEMLEAGFTNSLTHRYENGELKTDIIGVFTEAWVESSLDDDSYAIMYAKAIVYKRFPETIDAIKTLYEDDDLRFSWELVATDIEEKNGISYLKKIKFEGHCIVSSPAYPIAEATKLVATAKATKLVASLSEAYNKDLDGINSNDTANINENVCAEETSNLEERNSIGMNEKLKEFLAEVLTEKSIDDVRSEICEAIKASIDSEKYGAYIYDMYPSQVVYEQWDRETYSEQYFRVPYSISESSISVDMESKKEVVDVWMDKSDLEGTENPMISQGKDRQVSELKESKSALEIKIAELEEKVQTLSEVIPEVVLEVETEEVETEIAEVVDSENEVTVETPEIAEVETVVEEVEPTEEDVNLAKTVIELSESVKTLQAENAVLKPYRDKVIAEEAKAKEDAELAEQTRLSELVKKYTDEDEVPEEVKTFISEMNEDKVLLWIARNKIIVSEVNEVEVVEDDAPIVVSTPDENTLVEEQEKRKLY